MSLTIVNRRGRALVSLTAALGIALGAATIGTSPAQSVAPTPECTPYPGTPTKSDAVTALSVTSGTTPQHFTGKVLGVLQDGIAPDVDMVMVNIDAPDPATMEGVDGVDGIWQGMSGSPVYAADGTVIGAIAYGLSWGPSWIAGVTPFAAMDDYLTDPAPAKVQVGPAAARTIARSSDVTQAQAAEGFSQLPMPTGVSGVSNHRLNQAENHRKGHAWVPKSTYRMGAAAAAGDESAAGPATVVPGGNLAASLSYGDVTQGGVGTVTATCNGKVLGFGHPMTFLGKTTLTLHPADALFVQPESLGAPFKLANLGAPAGTISDDHLTGITGFLGATPETSEVTSTVSFGDRSRTGTSHVSVPQALAGTVFYEHVSNHDRTVDGAIPGSELLSWTITGRQGADDTPFSLEVTDRYASNYDITYESAWELADFVWSLSAIPGVTVDNVTMSSDVNDDSSTWRVSKIQQRHNGVWTTVGGRERAVAHAGKDLVLRAVLVDATGSTRNVLIPMAIPQRAAGARGELDVTGGAYLYSEGSSPESLDQAKRFTKTMVRNDELEVDLGLFGKQRIVGAKTFGPVDKVVSGHRSVRVVVQ